MELVEIMERIEDVGISLDMEKAIELGALTKSEKVEARKEKKKLVRRRKKLEKEVEKKLMGEKPKSAIDFQGKMLCFFCLFLTGLSFLECYITFN